MLAQRHRQNYVSRILTPKKTFGDPLCKNRQISAPKPPKTIGSATIRTYVLPRLVILPALERIAAFVVVSVQIRLRNLARVAVQYAVPAVRGAAGGKKREAEA